MCENLWLRDAERDSQFRYTTTAMSSIYSPNKFDGSSNAFVVPDKSVCDSTRLLESDVSGGKVQM